MWEWSKKFFNQKGNTSLVSAYKEFVANPSSDAIKKDTSKTIPTSAVAEIKNLLEEKIDKLDLKNIILIEKSYDPQTWQEMKSYFQNYERSRVAFLKLLAYSHTKELQTLGLNHFDIELLKEGTVPENYNTHIKIPFDFGGSCNFSNLSLIKSHPTHDYLHSLIDLQIEQGYLKDQKKIFIPYFEGKIYYD